MLLGNSIINLGSKCMCKMALTSQHSLYTNNLLKFFFANYPQHDLIQMPSLSPTMKEGNIAKWLKKEGDKVEPGDFLMEVETDKATVGYEMQESGYVAKILLPEGSKNVQLGSNVAILVQDESSVAKFKDYKPGEQAAASPAAEQPVEQPKEEPKPAAAAAPSGKTYPQHEIYELPSLSPTMKTGKLVKWDKKEGDKIAVGEVLCEIETDKAVVGFETQEDGFIAKILMGEGETSEIGRPIAVIVSKEELIKEFKDFVPGATAAQPQQQESTEQTQQKAPEAKTAEGAVQQQQQKSGDKIFISPLAKKVALENKISIDSLAGKGTGPNGRVIESDIHSEIQRLKEIAAKPTVQNDQPKKAAEPIAPLQNNPYKDLPNSQMRQIIAERLTSSKQTIPHYYLSIDVRMDKALKLREELNLENKVKISVNDMVVKATALACMDVPECNCQWGGEYIRQYQNCDVSVAVSTESGLITPIVFEANKLGLKQISEQTKKLAVKARERKLLPEEFQGGTITVSNLGMFGIDQFIGVINPPQACLLALGKTKKKIIANELAITPQDPAFKIVSEMTAYLSLDHRVVDGSVGAKWLQSFKKFLEKPNTMLL